MATNRYDVLVVIAQKAKNQDELDNLLKTFYHYENQQPPAPPELPRESVKQENKVILKDNQVVVKNTLTDFEVSISLDNPVEIIKQLQLLQDEQLDALQCIAAMKLSQESIFRNLLNGVAAEKNIVKGNISNVNEVKIGDEIQFDFHYYRIIKNTTVNVTNNIHL